MSIAQITTRLRFINSFLPLCVNGQMTFDEAMALTSFYRDFSETNSIIETAEKEATENIARG